MPELSEDLHADLAHWLTSGCGAHTNLMTRLSLTRLLVRQLARLLLLLHLIGIVLRVILLADAHVRLLAGHALMLLHRHAVEALLRQLRTHAHLIWSPASDSIAHVVYRESERERDDLVAQIPIGIT